MVDLNVEEQCPCGGRIKVSGYTSETRDQVRAWRGVHDKHANAIAKSLALAWVPVPPPVTTNTMKES